MLSTRMSRTRSTPRIRPMSTRLTLRHRLEIAGIGLPRRSNRPAARSVSGTRREAATPRSGGRASCSGIDRAVGHSVFLFAFGSSGRPMGTRNSAPIYCLRVILPLTTPEFRHARTRATGRKAADLPRAVALGTLADYIPAKFQRGRLVARFSHPGVFDVRDAGICPRRSAPRPICSSAFCRLS